MLISLGFPLHREGGYTPGLTDIPKSDTNVIDKTEALTTGQWDGLANPLMRIRGPVFTSSGAEPPIPRLWSFRI